MTQPSTFTGRNSIFRATRAAALLVFALDLASAALLDAARTFLRSWAASHDPRAALPAFIDHDAARLMFREQAESQQFALRPAADWSRRDYSGKTTNIRTIDGVGRRLTMSSPSAAAVARFFGSSSVWGIGVDDEHTIPARFARIRTNFRVENYGENALTSRQGLNRLIDVANQGAALDLVVFYDGATDVLMLCDPLISINGNLAEPLGRQYPFSPTSNPLLRGAFQPLVAMGTLLSAPLQKKPELGSRCDDPAYARRVAQTLFNDWQLAHDVTVAAGGHFVAILQPVAFVGKPRKDYLEQLPDTINGMFVGPNNPRLARMFNTVYPLIRESIRAHKSPWAFDFTDAFDGNSVFYVDYSHVNAAGSEAIARRLAAVTP